MTFTHEDLDRAMGTDLRTYAREAKLKGRSKLKVNALRQALRKLLPPRQGTSPGLFVELCAGTAALSLRLHKEQAKPPVSRMGAKTGYATAILHALGLYPGLKADHYLWCEPDDGCRLLLETYRDHGLAVAAAEIIRGWKDEDPKALWTRLRAEGDVRAPTPREVARWTLALPGGAWTMMPPQAMYKGPGAHPSRVGAHRQTTVAGRYEGLDELPADLAAEAVDPREVARFACLQARSYAQKPESIVSTYMEPNKEGGRCGPTAATLPVRLVNLDELPADLTAEAVDPREVARWTLALPGGAWTSMPPKAMYKGPGDHPSRVTTVVQTTMAARYENLPELPGEITDGAVEPPLLPPNTVVYIDPPYVNTTGYKHNLGRDRVVELALAWHAAGATVCVSEQVAIPELVAAGWRVVDISDKRQGQKRTFSVQKTEFLTISPEAAPQC